MIFKYFLKAPIILILKTIILFLSVIVKLGVKIFKSSSPKYSFIWSFISSLKFSKISLFTCSIIEIGKCPFKERFPPKLTNLYSNFSELALNGYWKLEQLIAIYIWLNSDRIVIFMSFIKSIEDRNSWIYIS